MGQRNVFDLSLTELEDWCTERGLPRYRAAQVTGWLYRHDMREFVDEALAAHLAGSAPAVEHRA